MAKQEESRPRYCQGFAVYSPDVKVVQLYQFQEKDKAEAQAASLNQLRKGTYWVQPMRIAPPASID